MSSQNHSDQGGTKLRYEVCPVSELPPGEKKIVEVENLSIGVFNVKSEYYALANACPHQLAPLCEGRITGDTIAPEVGEYEVVRDGEIIQCPWHGWKFDIATGDSIFNPHKLSIPTFDVAVESTTLERGKSDGDTDERSNQKCQYGTELMGDEPPIDTYDVEVEEDLVVLYV